MKMRFAVKLFILILALMTAVSSAMAVQYLTFEDIPGDWNNYESAVKWLNTEYVPTSDYAWTDTEVLDGGQVAPGVFEFIADSAYAYQNPEAICGCLYIDAPGEILYVSAFEGNWSTKEYMLLNCVATDGMYVELFFPSFDKDGKLLNTDRIYLYEYEADGERHYECVTFYFRYDGEETRSFLPKAVRSVSVKEAEATPAPEATEENTVTAEPTPASETQTETIAEQAEETTGEAIVTDDEAFSIGIIGGDDGPTSVIVAGPDGFNGFLGNVLSGVIGGFEEEVISTETVPAETTEPTTLAPEDYIAVIETYEEVIEEETTDVTAEATTEATGGMMDFFSGVFGGIGK